MQKYCRNNPCPVGRPRARYCCCGRCAGTHKCRERRDVQERQKSPKPFYPAVDIHGRINAARGWIHKSGLRPYCFSGRLAALRFPCSRLQVRGKPVQRGEDSLDLRLYPLHPSRPPTRGSAMYRDVQVPRAHGCARAAFGFTHPMCRKYKCRGFTDEQERPRLDRRGEKNQQAFKSE